MARSARMGALRGLGALLHRLHQRGLPLSATDEILAKPRASQIDRRHVLTGLGAGALAAGLPAPSRAAGQPTIAIVGAGIAGLSCALTLRRRGLYATVYEAAHRPGGRMHSNDSSWAEGQVSE